MHIVPRLVLGSELGWGTAGSTQAVPAGISNSQVLARYHPDLYNTIASINNCVILHHLFLHVSLFLSVLKDQASYP